MLRQQVERFNLDKHVNLNNNLNAFLLKLLLPIYNIHALKLLLRPNALVMTNVFRNSKTVLYVHAEITTQGGGMNIKEIINKLGNILEQYKEDQLEFYTQYEQKFIRENFDGEQTIIDIFNTGDWDVDDPKEGFAYDLGYIEGLEEALRILKEE